MIFRSDYLVLVLRPKLKVMKNLSILILAVALIACTAPKNVEIQPVPAILPKPQSVEMLPGTFEFSETVTISANSSESYGIAELLSTYLTGIQISNKIVDEDGSIQLNLDSNTDSEAYKLNISDEGVSINSEGTSGLFYGIQSLIQIISNNQEALPQLSIEDAPRFQYRGMHLDVCRHLFTVEFIKKYIDLMSRFKFNTFHWHLTEDQGWRIEIKKYPELMVKGAYRDETVVGHASSHDREGEKFDGKRYGGYYKQEEVKEIVAYAAARQVTIIPEIELPGHSLAALTAYPHLGCTGGPYATATTWGVFPDIYCAGKETTFEFLQDVFDEIIPLFPGKYVHVGGDEAPKDRWKTCPHCQKRIKDENLADEHELQSYFVQRMEKYLNSKGKTIIGWDEILEGGLAQNAVVMSWRGEAGGIEAAKLDHDVIMTPTGWCYFDYYQAGPEGEPLAFPGQMTTVEKVYSYEPIPAELSEEQAKHILGAQCNVWTEYILSGDHAEYMVYPRAIALSEILWSPKVENRDYQDFVERLNDIGPYLDEVDINYAKHLFDRSAN